MSQKTLIVIWMRLRVVCSTQRKNKPQQQAEELNNEGNDAGNKQNPNGVILGVEVVETNTKAHKVIVRGKNPDPTKVAERLQRKMDKHMDLISPILPKKEEKKPEPKVVEVVLKIFLHCDGCAKDINYCIHEMEVKKQAASQESTGSFSGRDGSSALFQDVKYRSAAVPKLSSNLMPGNLVSHGPNNALVPTDKNKGSIAADPQVSLRIDKWFISVCNPQNRIRDSSVPYPQVPVFGAARIEEAQLKLLA
ncbi:hypothetical protein RJ639_046818 [Escallonia herrerae]|uniref:Uncharacterized protein n=1 Tax=Escallonia herrerae TaxID=1293975 RepID=A0AA88WF73_9ASTE|nr:hypothetical protein RJ639_046818 [Escallonia herrerae]